MNILDKIVDEKRKEVEQRRSLYPVKLLEQSIFFGSPTVSMREYLTGTGRSGIIAEFKRRSPSKGDINRHADAGKVTLGYMQAGASALSVLTDEQFFGARKDDITAARRLNFCPLLRKDFIIDPYQVIESRSMGADTLLLIARILKPAEVTELATVARSLGMEVLLELHDRREAEESYMGDVDLVGINNRDLDTFEVNTDRSIELAEMLPAEMVKVAESGIDSTATITMLREHGFRGFLIGELFMRHADPAARCRELIRELERRA